MLCYARWRMPTQAWAWLPASGREREHYWTEMAMNGHLTREPPAPVKRQLRQEAGFGCCICGHPIYQYHHIRPFGLGHHHDLDDMMLLCPNHHHEATVGALEEPEQRHWKLHPFNIARGFAEGQLKIGTRLVVVEAGGNLFVGEGFKTVVDGEALLQLGADDDGRLQVSLDLYDRDDACLLSITQNEWTTGEPLAWDLEFGSRWLRLRRKRSDVALFIDARVQPVRVSADLWRRGQNFCIARDSLLFNGVVRDIGFRHVGFAGLMLAVDTTRAKFSIAPDPCLGRGTFFNWPDETTRVEWAIAQYRQLLTELGRRP